jgi:V8-like Glu-specific endopeptidase
MDWDDFSATAGIELEKNTGRSVCTGVLLAPKVVLTAAHCLVDLVAARVSNEEAMNQAQTWHVAREWQMHPNYRGNLPGQSVDVGLIFLATPLLDVAYATYAPYRMGEICERVGFGERSGRNVRTWLTAFPQALQGTSLKVQDAYGRLGDSGGPVYQNHTDGLRLIGVHTGREYGQQGRLNDVSFVQLLTPEIWAWVRSRAY